MMMVAHAMLKSRNVRDGVENAKALSHHARITARRVSGMFCVVDYLEWTVVGPIRNLNCYSCIVMMDHHCVWTGSNLALCNHSTGR